MPNTVSVSHRLKLSLSMNCLNNSVSSFSTAVITRASALSCSIRAFCLSEFCLAFWYALSAATRFGIVVNRVEVLDGALDPARDHHRPRLSSDLIQRQHLLVEMVDHDLAL
jgi:hypothetical protein